MKKKIIIFIMILIAIIAIGVFVYKKITKMSAKLEYQNDMKEYEERSKDPYGDYTMFVGNEQTILLLLMNDEKEHWTWLPLTKKFKKRYSKKRIIEDDNIIKWSKNDLDMTQGLEDRSIYYTLLCEKKDGIYAYIFDVLLGEYRHIDDIKIKSTAKIYDNTSGYTENYYAKFNKNNFMQLFEAVLFPKVNEKIKETYNQDSDGKHLSRKNIALTKNFINKYGYDEDVLKDEEGAVLTSFELKDGNFESRTFTCVCTYRGSNKEVIYNIGFDLVDGNLSNINAK